MKRLRESNNEYRWPRKAVRSVETRKRDLVIRISNWTLNRDQPGFDVECYIGGVYDWNQSQVLPTKAQAVTFAQQQIAKLL